MMMETYKCQDGQALGSAKIGDILAPPKTYNKNAYALKPNPLRNKLDTNPDPPIFPHSTNDFQEPIKFKSTLGNVFFGKESEKPSEEKPVEQPSGEKPSEQLQPKPKPKLMRFHCDYYGRDGHKGMVTRAFFSSRRNVRREWQRSGLTRTCTTHPMVYLSLMCRCTGPRKL
jgi:hypothetical protein